MLRLICDKPQSLKEFTENNYAQASFFWSYLLRNKEIRVNGKKTATDLFLLAGDTVEYYLTQKQADKPAFYPVYEDENFLIVDKESGVNSEAVFAALSREGEAYFIHRLDRNTKGLLAFAKTQAGETALLNAFKTRAVEKIYLALLVGELPQKTGVLTAYLKKDEGRATVKVASFPKSGYDKIVTEYETLSFDREKGLTKAAITLHTGKTHQIRAHFAHIGNPVLGDMKYGDERANKRFSLARQQLVAKKLRFSLTGEFAYLNEKIFYSRFGVDLTMEE